MKPHTMILGSLLAAAGGLLLARRKVAAPPDAALAERAAMLERAGPWTHDFATVNGLRIHYAATGQEGAPLVLLLHGFPECWYEWSHVMPGLAHEGGYRVVAPDMRGYNLSDKPQGIGNYTLDKLASDVPALIQALGYSSAYLVAHDWGGAVAWQVALDYPDQIDKLVILNAPHPDRYPQVIKRHLLQLLRSYYILVFQIPLLSELILRTTLRGTLRSSARVPGAFSEAALDIYSNGIAQPGAATAMLNYYRAAVRKPPAFYSRGRQSRVPTLVLWGAQDFALLREQAEGLEQWVPDLQVEFAEECGHWVPEEAPALVTRSLIRFLSS